jgi:single-strand DNA-binding protein
MSRDLNQITLIGRVTAAPTARQLHDGRFICTFRVATGHRPGGPTEWHRITCEDELAEIAALELLRGARVYIEGRVQTRRWVDEAGRERQITEIVAGEILPLDAPPPPPERVAPPDPIPPPGPEPYHPALVDSRMPAQGHL